MAFKMTRKCTACGDCIEECPVEAIIEGPYYSIDANACTECGICVNLCRFEAIVKLEAIAEA
jgi:ferredoxin